MTILFILGIAAVAVLSILSITVLYHTPTCTDGVKNQSETGIDCGGSCPYLCVAQERAPVVLFAKAITNDNRADLIASITNANTTAAAKDVPYVVTLLGADQVLIKELKGVIELPPGATVPLYIPNVASGNQKVVQAFLTIATSSIQWFSMPSDPRIVPVVSNTTLSGGVSTPRIDAVLSNSSVTPLAMVRVVIFVSDANGNIIAASQTIVPFIPAQGKATATFTWNAPFSGVPATIEVAPIVALP